MEAKAYLYDVRIAPRKVQIVLDLIRGKDVEMAAAILKNTPKRGAEILEKVLASAVANAENNHNMDKSKLYVSKCFVTPGSHMLKRVMPRGKGSANRILKRTSHITVAVKEKE
jgi:large subunit ribosomal protein L22